MILLILLALVGSLLVVPAVYVGFYFAWRPTVANVAPVEEVANERSGQ